jgi:hypothetical protein
VAVAVDADVVVVKADDVGDRGDWEREVGLLFPVLFEAPPPTRKKESRFLKKKIIYLVQRFAVKSFVK